MLWLLLLPSSAAPDSRLLFRTSPGAQVEALPTHGPTWFELAITENRVSLREQLPVSARYIRNIEAVSVGGGTSYLRIEADRDDLDLRVERRPAELVVVLEPRDGPPPPPEPQSPTPYEALVGSDPPLRRVATLPDVPIRPLSGDARSYRYAIASVPIGVEPWTGVGLEQLPAPLQVPPTTWTAADGFREVLTGPTGRTERVIARLLLAETYLAKGIPHEAAYYLDGVIGQRGPWSPALPHLQMARAQIGRGDLESAGDHCRSAALLGGDPLVVLRCLGAVALETGTPAPREVALAIEARATTGKALLLAAELMMADNEPAAAKRIATHALPELVGRSVGRAQLIVGDASYFLNDYESAQSAWTVAARHGFADVVRVRRVMVELAEAPRRRWPRHVPTLEALARRGGRTALEANYLLGQIAERFPDPLTAAQHYHQVWDADPRLALRSDIPERLLALCERYVDHLETDRRWTDLAIFARTCWRPDLDSLAADTALSESWARAYTELGLVNEALGVQRRVVRVRNELDQEEVGPLIELAALYTRSGRPREALETVDYVRRRLPPPAAHDPRLILRSAEAYAAMDDREAARRLWERALVHPDTRDAARRALGLLDAYEGRCASAIRRLTEADTTQQLARARCALEMGRAAEAEQLAADVVVNADDAFAGEGTWLLGAAAFAQRRPERVDEAEGAGALWAAVLTEEAEARAFEEELLGRGAVR